MTGADRGLIVGRAAGAGRPVRWSPAGPPRVAGQVDPRRHAGRDPVGAREQHAADRTPQPRHLRPHRDDPLAGRRRGRAASSAAVRPAGPCLDERHQDLGVPGESWRDQDAAGGGDPQARRAGEVEHQVGGARRRPRRPDAAASRRPAAPRPPSRASAARPGRRDVVGSATRSGSRDPMPTARCPSVSTASASPLEPRQQGRRPGPEPVELRPAPLDQLHRREPRGHLDERQLGRVHAAGGAADVDDAEGPAGPGVLAAARPRSPTGCGTRRSAPAPGCARPRRATRQVPIALVPTLPSVQAEPPTKPSRRPSGVRRWADAPQHPAVGVGDHHHLTGVGHRGRARRSSRGHELAEPALRAPRSISPPVSGATSGSEPGSSPHGGHPAPRGGDRCRAGSRGRARAGSTASRVRCSSARRPRLTSHEPGCAGCNVLQPCRRARPAVCARSHQPRRRRQP